MMLGMRAFARTTPPANTLERAFDTGLEADRLGVAFIGAYQAALDKLVETESDVVPPKRRSLANTEKGGGHPRAIETRLENGTLSGTKTFATCAPLAEELLVVASRGVVDGKNRLCLVRVPPDAGGASITPRTPTPFAPEIPHAIVTLVNVAVNDADVLSGDGYQRYLKPFRTIEDTHALTATIGYLLGAAKRAGMKREMTEGLLALLAATEQVGTNPVGHLVLAGLFAGLHRLLAQHDAEWEKASADERDRWRRDLPLLGVLEQVQTKRTASAWDTLLATHA